jgi:uncharacterized protein YdeI (YjbR/CyaY-like superfamily)
MLNPLVDLYLADGCGRCALVRTPQCKVHLWTEELKLLRSILSEYELIEELKWSMPCYTLNGKNVILLGAFKEYVSFSFLKGSLLEDKKGLLERAGENSNIARLIKFKSLEHIQTNEKALRAFITQAIEIEKQGKKVTSKPTILVVEELQAFLKENAALKKAFEELSPGKQRGYNIFFAGAKQSKTRIERIKKSIPNIMKGKGMQDR